MTSQLYIYDLQDWSVADNYAVEDIEAYLSALTPIYTDTSFQYVRPALNTSIKIALGDSQTLNFGDHGGYVKIYLSNEGNIYYYYVMNVRYVAPKTALLELGLDTINTYWDEIQTQLTSSDRHLVHRQHKDRFADLTGSRIIDRYPEEFTPALFPNSSPTQITNENDSTDRNWYLVYQTVSTDENSEVNCYAYCEPRALHIESATADTQTITSDDVLAGVWYYLIADTDCPTPGLTFGSTTYTIGTDDVEIIGFRLVSGTTTFQMRGWDAQGDAVYNTTTSEDLVMNSTRRVYYNATTTVASEYVIQLEYIREMPYQTLVSGTVDAQYVETLDAVNRKDPTIIKIIELPYAPFTPEFSSGLIEEPSGWTYDYGKQAFKLNDLEKEFIDKVDSLNIDNSVSMIYDLTTNPPSSDEERRSWEIESKLYNSQFYDWRFLYDTTTWSFKPEFFDWNGDTGVVPELQIQFKPSNGINSTCGFRFYPDEDFIYYDNSDYPGYMIASRTNDKPIYTSEYLNYLKYGKGYEWTQVGENIAKSAVGFVSTIGLGIAGAALSSHPAGLVIGAVISGIAQGTNMAISIAQNVQTQQQKEVELKNQAASVSGNTDLDIFRWYSGNRLCYNVYEPTDIMRQMLYNYFYYFGYADNSYGAIDTYTRLWWNYIQADIVFTNPSMQQEFVDDIKARFQLGLTVMHDNEGSWDWARDRENWETNLLKPVLDTDWVEDATMDDDYGFTFIYSDNASVTLDGETYWLEWRYWNDYGGDETGTTYGETVEPGYEYMSGDSGQYYYSGAQVAYRLVAADDATYQSSDWVTISLDV